MTVVKQEEFEKTHDVRLVRKDKYWLSNIINKIFPSFDNFWTTFRLPFCKAVITYPTIVNTPMLYTDVLKHELVHVKQLKPWYGPFLVALLYAFVPLPVFFSGRWFIERDAYLLNINDGVYTPEEAAHILTVYYWLPWPKSWMIKWFKNKVEK
jgi:hypothetical protein